MKKLLFLFFMLLFFSSSAFACNYVQDMPMFHEEDDGVYWYKDDQRIGEDLTTYSFEPDYVRKYVGSMQDIDIQVVGKELGYTYVMLDDDLYVATFAGYQKLVSSVDKRDFFKTALPGLYGIKNGGAIYNGTYIDDLDVSDITVIDRLDVSFNKTDLTIIPGSTTKPGQKTFQDILAYMRVVGADLRQNKELSKFDRQIEFMVDGVYQTTDGYIVQYSFSDGNSCGPTPMYTFLPKNLINDISSIVGFEQVSEEFYIATTQKDNFTTTVATQALSALDKRFARLGSRGVTHQDIVPWLDVLYQKISQTPMYIRYQQRTDSLCMYDSRSASSQTKQQAQNLCTLGILPTNMDMQNIVTYANLLQYVATILMGKSVDINIFVQAGIVSESDLLSDRGVTKQKLGEIIYKTWRLTELSLWIKDPTTWEE